MAATIFFQLFNCTPPTHPHHIECSDQRLYVQQLPADGGPAGEPRPLTAADSKQRFADGDVDAARNRCEGFTAERSKCILCSSWVG